MSMTRQQRAIVALHDYGSREGATAKSVNAAMKKAGFTAEEIAEAVKAMSGNSP